MLPNKFTFSSNVLVILLTVVLSACTAFPTSPTSGPSTQDDLEPAVMINTIPLPPPDLIGVMPLEEALSNRRSTRGFQDTPLTDAHIGQLLWAAQGITHPSGLRTAPSAGALYPLEIYAATQDGLFHYRPHTHSLEKLLEHDPRPALYQAALRQNSVLEAPLVILISAVFERTAQKYGEARTPQYVYLEAGHAAQNILLQAVALDLDAVPIGAFHEDQISQALALPPNQTLLYLIPVGHPE